MIDLRSDTVTRPSPAMLEAMFRSKVGDDVFGEDPTINLLQEKVAELFGQEAALFCPSGTMCNQISVKTHTQPLDEIILDKTAHIYLYETGGFAFHSGVSVRTVNSPNGIMTAEMVEENIQPDFDWLPRTKLVSLENTSNKGGGTCYDLENIRAIKKVCKRNSLKLHLDGARIFNAIVAKGYTAKEIGQTVDSITVSFSKGLGAPVGSVLAGGKDFIAEARRIRKVMGGGMRQAGYLAAAGLYALKHNIKRLEEDHRHARQIADVLNEAKWVSSVIDPETNILIFEVDENKTSVAKVLDYLKEKDILGVQFGKNQIRLVTHLDVSADMIGKVCSALMKFKFS